MRVSISEKGASGDQQRQIFSSIDHKGHFYFSVGDACLPDNVRMNEFITGVNIAVGADRLEPISCREVLRSATQGPHERLHLHSGFSVVRDGTITLADYRALLTCLYGFYLPFERAVGIDPIRTQWLEWDLRWLGVNSASFPRIRLCADIPKYDCQQRQLGALYVIEGSALGGRLLCRGLDRLLGVDSIEGRQFFAGRGNDTGAAWHSFLDRLASVSPEPMGRAALVSAAVETFQVFEAWLSGWSERE